MNSHKKKKKNYNICIEQSKLRETKECQMKISKPIFNDPVQFDEQILKTCKYLIESVKK